MMPLSYHSQSRRSARGFSLAESLFAMTIVTFVLLVMIGTMPSALSNLKDAERRALEMRICQTLLADFEGRTWKNLAAQGTITTFFDDEGVALSSGRPDPNRPTHAPNFAVSAMLVGDPNNALASHGTLPNETKHSPYLRYVRIAITSRAQDDQAVTQMQSALSANNPTGGVHIYTFVIADLEPHLTKRQASAP